MTHAKNTTHRTLATLNLPARETGACIDVAEALGYVERVEPLLLDALDQVRAILVGVTR